MYAYACRQASGGDIPFNHLFSHLWIHSKVQGLFLGSKVGKTNLPLPSWHTCTSVGTEVASTITSTNLVLLSVSGVRSSALLLSGLRRAVMLSA